MSLESTMRVAQLESEVSALRTTVSQLRNLVEQIRISLEEDEDVELVFQLIASASGE